MEQIKITVNGRELIGEKGETVLNIAARGGIEIPRRRCAVRWIAGVFAWIKGNFPLARAWAQARGPFPCAKV